MAEQGIMEEKTWGAACVCMGRRGDPRRAPVNNSPPARGSPAECQELTFGKEGVVCIRHSVMPRSSK